jgi:hypothetical protein
MNKSGNIIIKEFNPVLVDTLPETYRLLRSADLTVHPNVKSIILEGSRGLANRYRPDSDIDLNLVTDLDVKAMSKQQLGHLLEEILNTTLKISRCKVELDLAAVFDGKGCGLACFDVVSYERLQCDKETVGCLEAYKIQKGFNGFVPPIIQVSKMYPMIEIWHRSRRQSQWQH